MNYIIILAKFNHFARKLTGNLLKAHSLRVYYTLSQNPKLLTQQKINKEALMY